MPWLKTTLDGALSYTRDPGSPDIAEAFTEIVDDGDSWLIRLTKGVGGVPASSLELEDYFREQGYTVLER